MIRRHSLSSLENAVFLLRSQSAATWSLYLLGAVPFLLFLLSFFRDMSTDNRPDRCLPESLVCALFFLWASFWKARFSGSLFSQLSTPGEPSRLNYAWQCVWVQAAIQPFKLLILPFAIVSVIPLPWVTTVFRAVNLEANRPGVTPARALARAVQSATGVQSRGWISLLITAAAGTVLLVNVLTAFLLVPMLLKVFTGMETEWTRRPAGLVSGQTFAVGLALTWLLLDPLLQAYSAVRTFHFKARSDGRDLLLQLRQLTAIVAIVSALAIPTAWGQSFAGEKRTPHAVPVLRDAEVQSALREAALAPQYDWLRRGKDAGIRPPWFDRIFDDLRRGVHRVGSWFAVVADWIGKLFGSDSRVPSHGSTVRSSTHRLQWLMYLAMVILPAAMVALFLRRRRSEPGSAAPTGPSPVNLQSNDPVLATDRPGEQWLALAREYAGRSELRLAIRALYLANLSYLGSRQLLQITKSKSNGLYEHELKRRCRSATVCLAFSQANRIYEETWFGAHLATPELAASLEAQVMAVRAGD